MQLQEKHKEFAVKCFAEYMQLNEVTDAFIEQFQPDLPQPPAPPEPPSFAKDITGIDCKFNQDEYVAHNMDVVKEQYMKTYGNQAQKKLAEDHHRLIEDLKKDFKKQWTYDRKKQYDRQLDLHRMELNDHSRKLKSDLSNQLRRFNITHSQFPEKYRQLFEQTRAEFFQIQHNDNLPNNEEIRVELETIYSYVKNLIYKERKPIDALRHVNMAHSILKTLASYNNNSQQQTNTDKEIQKNEEATNK